MPPKTEKPTPDELREITSRLSMIQDDLRSNRSISAFEKVSLLKEHIEYLAARKN